MTTIMDYPYRFRRRPETFAPGLVRIDRAVPFIIQHITRAIQQLEALKTKTLGSAEFVISRLEGQLQPLCSMSGDNFLSERVGYQLSRMRSSFNSRTMRPDAIQALRDILTEIEGYEPLQQLASSEDLLDAQNTEGGKKSEPADLAKEGSLFVIMPFSQDFNDVWKGAIQSSSKASNFHPIRVDTINRSTNITDDIVESIKNCRIAVVDVTGNNPNVMYELGYVMALEKPYVIISQSVEFLPFDIRNIRTIVYANTWSGIEELRGKLHEFLKQFSSHSKASRPRKGSK